MVDIPFIARAAALIGDPARANMLCALKDDKVLSATELAQVAGVASNTASGHLAKLIEAGMVTAERKGRHKFFKLAGAEVADALESLEALAERTEPFNPVDKSKNQAIRFSRSCYDHLAGQLGVELGEALVRLGHLERTSHGFGLVTRGADAFTALGIDLEALKSGRRRLLRACPDWSQDSVHVGGSLGASLFRSFVGKGWIRTERGSRIVQVTPKGRAAFRSHFSINI